MDLDVPGTTCLSSLVHKGVRTLTFSQEFFLDDGGARNAVSTGSDRSGDGNLAAE